MLNDAPPAERKPNGCRSWPHCEKPAAASGRFCAKHQEALNRVGRSINPRKFNSHKTAAEVKVTREPPRRLQQERSREILDALAAGPMTSPELAKAANAKRSDRTFARARQALLTEGKITAERVGRAHRYALAAA